MPKIHALMEQTTRATKAAPAKAQSLARQEVAARVLSIFETKRWMRDQRHPLFRDRTPRDYWDDCVKRYIQFKRRPAHKKAWQSNLASSKPNEKLISVLSRLATKGMEARVRSDKELSLVEGIKERIGNIFLKAAAVKNEDDFQIILEMLEAAEKGTVIGMEDWFHGKSKKREIIDQDSETGELKFEEKVIKEWNDVRSTLVNLEDFYPGRMDTRPGKIQDMDDCFLRIVMTEDEFDSEYEKYPDADKVVTKSALKINESTPFWKWPEDLGNDEVQVILYFNKKTDEYVIIANDIWINPVGKDTISPLPWNHKRLPFWSAVFEAFDSKWFYGRALIDKLISYADSSDAIMDRVIDQMTLSVSKPVLASATTTASISKGFLQPNNIIETTWTEGKPHFETVPINDPPAIGFTLLTMIAQNMDTAVTGAPTSGKKKTNYQQSVDAEFANSVISLFQSMMENGIKDKNRLRLPNCLQFYSMPVHQREKDKGSRFKRVILRNEEMSNGKRGSIQVSIVPEVNQLRTEQSSQQNSQNTEIIETTVEFIRNISGDIEMVAQSSIKMTDAQRQLLETNFQKTLMEIYPDKLNRDEGFDQLVIAFDRDPIKLKAKTQAQLQDMGPAMAGTGTRAASPANGIPNMTGL